MSKGFSLVEILIVITMIGILSVISVPFYSDILVKNNEQTALLAIAGSWRKAMMMSIAQVDDKNWGLKILPGSVVIFQGTSYSSRNAAYDKVIKISDQLFFSGLEEIVFGKFTGSPAATGTLNLQMGENAIKSISINEKGMITY